MQVKQGEVRLGAPAQTVLITLLVGFPFAFLAAVFAQHHQGSPAVARPLPAPPSTLDRVLYGPLFSATHWNHSVISYAAGDQGVYGLNYAASIDPEHDTEVERSYRPYPPGTVLTKEHRPASGAGPSLFTTTMIRTIAPHGPAADPWRYERADETGRIVFSGYADDVQIGQQCADCHGNAKGRDFVFHNHPLRQ